MVVNNGGNKGNLGETGRKTGPLSCHPVIYCNRHQPGLLAPGRGRGAQLQLIVGKSDITDGWQQEALEETGSHSLKDRHSHGH